MAQAFQNFSGTENLPDCDKFKRSYCTVPNSFGTEKFRQWLSEFKKVIAKVRSKDARRMLNPCRQHLEVKIIWLLKVEHVSFVLLLKHLKKSQRFPFHVEC